MLIHARRKKQYFRGHFAFHKQRNAHVCILTFTRFPHIKPQNWLNGREILSSSAQLLPPSVCNFHTQRVFILNYFPAQFIQSFGITQPLQLQRFRYSEIDRYHMHINHRQYAYCIFLKDFLVGILLIDSRGGTIKANLWELYLQGR